MKINSNKPYHIFAEHVEQEALNQFESALNCDFSTRGALMPDAHTGYSLPIGAVVETKHIIVPSWVGFDVGCGVSAIQTTYEPSEIRLHSKEIFDEIYRTIPVGFKHNTTESSWDFSHLNPTDTTKSIFETNGLLQLCSLGGGNHFIEIGEDENQSVWIIIHSGSRGIGHAVASHYMKLASPEGNTKDGHFGLHEDSNEGRDYINDLEFCLHFALENRTQMTSRVINAINKFSTTKFNLVDTKLYINKNHNHAERKDGHWIHRKGATPADEGTYGVIPGNMRDGTFIVIGLGNRDSLMSSSHGAGRVMGRKAAQRTLNMADFENSMTGITAKVTTDTLDESAFAYKNIFEVMELQNNLVKTVAHVKPIINIKG